MRTQEITRVGSGILNKVEGPWMLGSLCSVNCARVILEELEKKQGRLDCSR